MKPHPDKPLDQRDAGRHSPQRRRALGYLLAGVSLPAVTPSRAAPAEVPSAGEDGGIALVLGGGGCRGYGHIGVLRVLDRHGFQPDLLVGSSAGSLVGALYAAGKSADEIERIGYQISPNLLRDWIFPKLGVFGGDAINRFIKHQVAIHDIEDLPRGFAAVSTDLATGELLVFSSGDLGRAVQASSSIPGLIEPVRIGNRLCVDGNLAAPVPVEAARQLGASRVIAVDVTFPPEQANLSDPFDALYQGFSILTRHMAIEERSRADLVLLPQIPVHDDMSADTLKSLVRAGEQAASAALPALEKMFARA